MAADAEIWPDAAYQDGVEALRAHLGEPVWLLETTFNGWQAPVLHPGEPVRLLAVVEYPEPDPRRGLMPHLLITDDGLGRNLGRLLRVSVERPFDPAPEEVLYRNGPLVERLCFRQRRLSHAWLREAAHYHLGRVLGRPTPPPAIPGPAEGEGRDEGADG
ncbi:hypothetical protein SAMN05660831_01228 [Thiohalospira halophila DSM 15071]|uniref:Uncharacterized protein n=1 Tax=Thiohalospira halophila DSM 15071 TaxID=1123397 RepID=A0A1I1QQ97_9GAMM|nr:hypothetical protein [Thiohalospira halophila]SFD24296.1 hypothetical protein SAMN05660831_01228 [Thiohalospira halophila DSM 15071]